MMQFTADSSTPLALRIRPRNLKEFVGQDKILGKGTVLRQAIEGDSLTSVIFWGPPGTGKTTLAMIIASITKADFIKVSAVDSSVKEVRKIIKAAEERQKGYGRKTIMLLDEVHRFNKAQQDALLPAVEDATIVLIGTTTENPYFSVNAALISRSRVFQFLSLTDDELREVLHRALEDNKGGLGSYKIELDDDAMEHIIRSSGGDARIALNVLETAAMTAVDAEKEKARSISIGVVEDATQKRAVLYDRMGDAHYDTISAFIKSLRGSDPHAATYWLARMIYAGEDPRFIARRMVIFASEDIGNADPQALVIATSAAQAVEFVGMPEAKLNLAQAALYLSTAEKSNSTIKAINEALQDVEKGEAATVPKHLRNPAHSGLREHNYGKGYKYPHDYPDHYVDQDYLPSNLKGKHYYKPSKSGHEKAIRSRLDETNK